MAEEKPLKSILFYSNMYADSDKSSLFNPEKTKEILEMRVKEASPENKGLAEQQLGYYNENPNFYSSLAGIQSEISSNDDAKSKITKGENGELCLAVMMKDMEGSPLAFAIRDGRVTFATEQISKDQMKEILYFLWKRGITDFECPKETAEPIQESFKSAEDELLKENTINEEKIDTLSPQIVNGEADENQNGENYENNSFQEDTANNPPAPTPTPAPSANKSFDKSKSKENVSKWLTDARGKTNGGSFFITNRNGWREYRVYPKNNEDNLSLDGVKDKKGFANSTYSYVIFDRPRADGKGMEYGYCMPDGKTVDGFLADKLVGLNKSQGLKKINIGNLSDDDKGAFIKSCGKAQMIPTGIPLGCVNINVMLKESEGRCSSEQQLQYKYDLIQEMMRQAEKEAKKNNKSYNNPLELLKDNERDLAGATIEEYKYKALRDGFEYGMRGIMSEAVRSGEATKYIAACESIDKVNTMYELKDSEGNSLNWGQTLAYFEAEANTGNGLFSADQIAAMKNLGVSPDMEMSKMKPEEIKNICNSLMAREEQNATTFLQSQIDENNIRPADEKQTYKDVIKDAVNGANNKVTAISDNLETKGLKNLHIPRPGNLKYINANQRQPNGRQGCGRP